ncbi:hypothetical protein PanWU01x14_056480 [Parasponia andersonii]|uniref:Uncharacterized protein n=1 Tax=Parasponia andersonii TaxID=3476 RepID=A0A2P5DKF7_PARAD|nr:hypothetical protein PanWU01x14_056480 [Parasponia andersonii]
MEGKIPSKGTGTRTARQDYVQLEELQPRKAATLTYQGEDTGDIADYTDMYVPRPSEYLGTTDLRERSNQWRAAQVYHPLQ